MKEVYPVIFTETKDKKNTVLIEVPDWDILTEGFGIPDAVAMARDAIGLKGICYQDQEKELPKPHAISDLDVKSSAFGKEGESFVSLVDVDFTEYRRMADNRMVRRNVTLPNWLDLAAQKAGLNVSKVLQNALMEVLGMEKNSV